MSTYSDRVRERRKYERRMKASDNIVAAIYGATVVLTIVALCLTILSLHATGAL